MPEDAPVEVKNPVIVLPNFVNRNVLLTKSSDALIPNLNWNSALGPAITEAPLSVLLDLIVGKYAS